MTSPDSPESTLQAVMRGAAMPEDATQSLARRFQGRTAADDVADTHAARAELQGVWGEDTDEKIAQVRRYVANLPKDVAQVLYNARDGSGRAFANDPATFVRVAGMAAGPEAHTIADIERLMRTDRRAYDRDPVIQAKYRELLDAQVRSR